MCFSLAIRDTHLASCWLSVRSVENFLHLGLLRSHLLAFFRHHRANIGLAVARSAGPILPPIHDQQTYSRYWAQTSSTGLLLCTHGVCMVWSWCLLAVNNIPALCCARWLLLWTQYRSIWTNRSLLVCLLQVNRLPTIKEFAVINSPKPIWISVRALEPLCTCYLAVSYAR